MKPRLIGIDLANGPDRTMYRCGNDATGYGYGLTERAAYFEWTRVQCGEREPDEVWQPSGQAALAPRKTSLGQAGLTAEQLALAVALTRFTNRKPTLIERLKDFLLI